MMYTLTDMIWLFFIYSFAGWCMEVCYAALRRKKFVNRCFVNSPVCPIYGFSAVLFAVFLPELTERPFFLFLGGMLLASLMEYATGMLMEKIFQRKLWDYSEIKYNLSGYICARYCLLWGLLALASMLFLNPVLCGILKEIPGPVTLASQWLAAGLLLLDFVTTSMAVLGMKLKAGRLTRLSRKMKHTSRLLENRLTAAVQRRMQRAFPSIEEASGETRSGRAAAGKRRDASMDGEAFSGKVCGEAKTAGSSDGECAAEGVQATEMAGASEGESVAEGVRVAQTAGSSGEECAAEEAGDARTAGVFAQGCCFYKLVALFFIGAFLGDITETILCLLTTGVLMSRSSVVYGPFSIVWGLGCALLTLFLYRYRNKSDRHIFLAGTLLGGVYEYVCSVFTELVFGTVFWDYSGFAFNLGGRINLLYCFFWGIAAVVWLKMIYPKLSDLIERLPVRAGKILCNCLIVFMIFNMAISSLALARYTERHAAAEQPLVSEGSASQVPAGSGAGTAAGDDSAGTSGADMPGSSEAGTAAGDASDTEPDATSALNDFLDKHFPDERMERIYPNAKIVD